MGYIDSGKKEGAKVHIGGERHGTTGYFIQPTIFTDTTPDMKITREEIFGPVAAIIKFKTEAGASSIALHASYVFFFWRGGADLGAGNRGHRGGERHRVRAGMQRLLGEPEARAARRARARSGLRLCECGGGAGGFFFGGLAG